jgi:hypothetical protein
VENPFRSEAAAYRFLLVTIAAFALIVAAKLLLGTAAAVVVWLAVTAGAFVLYARRRSEPPLHETPRVEHEQGRRCILVIANETVGGEALRERIQEHSRGHRTNLLVVTPALNSPVRTFTSDVDKAREEAQQRLDASLARLRRDGIEANGEVGDGDPLQAIEDALRTFGADEIIISTHPEGRSNWLERGIVDSTRERFACPVTHVVVDLALDERPASTA